MRLLKILLLLNIFFSCKAQPRQAKLIINKNENSLLWEVSGNGLAHPSYLFGTFHLMCKDDIHLSKQLKIALSQSDTVYMEMDMDDPSTMLGGLLFMNMKDGKTLEQLYTPAEYKKVKAFFTDSLHTPISFLQSMKPMLLEALLYPKLMPCKSVSGVEEELMKIAKQEKKEIKGLETMEFQASVFDSIPYAEQAKELLNAIDSLSAYKTMFDTMMNVYKSQRIDEIETLFNKSEFGMKDHQDILLNDRNKNWVKQLKVITKTTNVFVAVGAGHLVGKEGLISLLRKEGYTVKPLQNQ